MQLKPTILYVDDEQTHLDAFQSTFGSDYTIRTCLSGMEAIEIMNKEGDHYPLLIVDQTMPGLTGIEVCKKIASIQPHTIRIMLADSIDTQFLLDAINSAQVHRVVVKPWKKDELKLILEKAFQEYGEKVTKLHELEMRANKDESLEIEIREMYDSGTIIGEESGLKQEMEVIKKVAPTDSTILILGETGTGKELLARALHERSRRKSGPFVPVHCASLVETLMESELFGYEKGAFTGASEMHRGRFEIAKGGTIFLDEIGELPDEIQVKLLRVLQEKEIYRVGGNRPTPVDVRLISATHRNLEEMVRKGKFREDLFYRLNVIMMRVPPLRERKEDLSRLAFHFLKKCCRNTGKYLSFPSETIEYLSRYDWPGNIRELQNVIERAAILSEGPTITPEDLNLNIEQTLHVEQVDLNQVMTHPSVKSKVRGEEMQKLSELLVKAKGNITEAARLSGIPRTTLFHRLRKYHLI
jgi:DNA-binding NtrC family response regulator